jgi:hypothetical protein
MIANAPANPNAAYDFVFMLVSAGVEPGLSPHYKSKGAHGIFRVLLCLAMRGIGPRMAATGAAAC